MATLTASQIADVISVNTLHAPSWEAIAIALCESGGNTLAVHINTDGTRDRGLWQFNSKWHSEVSDACAFDPVCAAKAMVRVSNNQTNWTQWSCYKNGGYLKYKTTAQAAVNKQDRGPVSGALDTAGNIVSGAVDSAAAVGKFLGELGQVNTWIRIAEVLAGIVLLFFGIKFLAGELGMTEQFKSAAGKLHLAAAAA